MILRSASRWPRITCSMLEIIFWETSRGAEFMLRRQCREKLLRTQMETPGGEKVSRARQLLEGHGDGAWSPAFGTPLVELPNNFSPYTFCRGAAKDLRRRFEKQIARGPWSGSGHS
jgi:hypothetical protein